MNFYKAVKAFYRARVRFALLLVAPLFIAGAVLKAKGAGGIALVLIFLGMVLAVGNVWALYKKMRDFSFACPECGARVKINLWTWKDSVVYLCPRCGRRFKKDYEFICNGGAPSPKS